MRLLGGFFALRDVVAVGKTEFPVTRPRDEAQTAKPLPRFLEQLLFQTPQTTAHGLTSVHVLTVPDSRYMHRSRLRPSTDEPWSACTSAEHGYCTHLFIGATCRLDVRRCAAID
jgi:hypothetical protein